MSGVGKRTKVRGGGPPAWLNWALAELQDASWASSAAVPCDFFGQKKGGMARPHESHCHEPKEIICTPRKLFVTCRDPRDPSFSKKKKHNFYSFKKRRVARVAASSGPIFP